MNGWLVMVMHINGIVIMLIVLLFILRKKVKIILREKINKKKT